MGRNIKPVSELHTFEQALSQCTERQSVYVWAYLKYANRRKAGAEAGYRSRHGIDRAHNTPHVLRAIELGQLERWNHLKADAELVLRELLDMVSADPLDAFDENGRLLPLGDWPVALRKRLASFEAQELDLPGAASRVIKAKMVAPDRLIELLGKHITINAFRDTVAVEDATAFTARLEAARRRVIEGKSKEIEETP